MSSGLSSSSPADAENDRDAQKRSIVSMEYFWKQYEQLPETAGYGRFSSEHIITLIVLAVLIFCFVSMFRKQGEVRREKILFVIPFVMIAFELFKDGFLVRAGAFDEGYLPLHLCSIGVFVFLLSALSKAEKWKLIFGEISVILILPGSIAALLFPDWADLYPVWNFMNLYGYVWHGMLVLVPLLMLMQGQADPSIRHIHYVILFLACVVPPVYIFDRVFRCNYMFVNWPPRGTPLEWIAGITGSRYYLAGYAVFAVTVIICEYILIHMVRTSTWTHRE